MQRTKHLRAKLAILHISIPKTLSKKVPIASLRLCPQPTNTLVAAPRKGNPVNPTARFKCNAQSTCHSQSSRPARRTARPNRGVHRIRQTTPEPLHQPKLPRRVEHGAGTPDPQRMRPEPASWQAHRRRCALQSLPQALAPHQSAVLPAKKRPLLIRGLEPFREARRKRTTASTTHKLRAPSASG